MSEIEGKGRLFREAVAEYSTDPAGSSHAKLSISLPTELLDVVKAAAAESGQSVSAVIAASLRRTLEDAEQAQIDRAVALDAEENLEWADAFVPITAKLWSELEW